MVPNDSRVKIDEADFKMSLKISRNLAQFFLEMASKSWVILFWDSVEDDILSPDQICLRH